MSNESITRLIVGSASSRSTYGICEKCAVTAPLPAIRAAAALVVRHRDRELASLSQCSMPHSRAAAMSSMTAGPESLRAGRRCGRRVEIADRADRRVARHQHIGALRDGAERADRRRAAASRDPPRQRNGTSSATREIRLPGGKRVESAAALSGARQLDGTWPSPIASAVRSISRSCSMISSGSADNRPAARSDGTVPAEEAAAGASLARRLRRQGAGQQRASAHASVS